MWLLFVLISEKTAATYYRFSFRRGSGSEGNFVIEPGLIEIVKSKLAARKHTGCHFHSTQAIWRVQNLGLVSAGNNSEKLETEEFIQFCMALAFIAENSEKFTQFDECINSLTDENHASMYGFINHFRNKWVSGLTISHCEISMAKLISI